MKFLTGHPEPEEKPKPATPLQNAIVSLAGRVSTGTEMLYPRRLDLPNIEETASTYELKCLALKKVLESNGWIYCGYYTPKGNEPPSNYGHRFDNVNLMNPIYLNCKTIDPMTTAWMVKQ